ncbi:hypothetical protein DPMN_113055 [Dreissena polymorpha]|uniref:Uncharacterized protein n=1 Tax=Dreissena polymorpha TaxID=45954 RepID=A0A9D4QQL1_DREPO|nr:hypothetical protein DPMN_113055 [Dreissena polymorpha]
MQKRHIANSACAARHDWRESCALRDGHMIAHSHITSGFTDRQENIAQHFLALC